MTAAEYIARMADTEPIEAVEEETVNIIRESSKVKQAVEEFWCEFWQEISRRYL